MAVDETVWDLTPHTAAKHVILKQHLDAWLPIMTATYDRLLFIDGFAGPGRYRGGELGSPIIALRAAVLNARFRQHPPLSQLRFLFIEEDRKRYESLRDGLAAFVAANPLPSWVTYSAEHATFADHFGPELDHLRGPRAPAIFAFIDPFGYSGLPMSLIAKIQDVVGSECLINFASRSIMRWVAEYATRLELVDELFGSAGWGPRRNDEHALVRFYGDQLRALAGFQYIRTFEMRGAHDVTEYFLAFATNNAKGLSVFKQAAWKADPHSGRMFSDAADPNQGFLVSPLAPLRDLLQGRFGGRRSVRIEEVEEWVRVETDYSEASHLKMRALKDMEVAGNLSADGPTSSRRRRPGEYPPGTWLHFL